MWPGDQQHGGGQNPQQPNPYQQPGYQQPNPYQQPGYGYPQQGPPHTGGQQWGATTLPGGPQPPQGGGRNSKTTAIAIITAVAVVAAAVITGVFLLRGDDEEKNAANGGDSASPSGQSSASPSSSPSPDPSPEESKDASAPVVPGWQSVINPGHNSAFDIPKSKDWEVKDPDTITGFPKKGTSDLLVAMSAPAYYKEGYCEGAFRAVVGTKGAKGAKGTKSAAEIAASNWLIAAYDQKQKGTLKESGAKPFSNEHGITGHSATATLTGAPTNEKCDVSSAKVYTISWKNSKGNLKLWVYMTDTGFDGAVPEAKVKKMMNSLREYNAGGGTDSRG